MKMPQKKIMTHTKLATIDVGALASVRGGEDHWWDLLQPTPTIVATPPARGPGG